jgi:hypothetical protein
LDNGHDATDDTGGFTVRFGWRDVPALIRQAFCETLLWWLALAAIVAYGWCGL